MKTHHSTLDNKAEETAAPGSYRKAARGQALLIVALVMTLLILFVGLAVDTGNLMAKKAKLQSAVDAAALSAADVLGVTTNVTQTATNTAYQVLETNGVTSNTLTTRNVSFPGYRQVQVAATMNVGTFFMRLVPAFATMQVSAQATADLNSYAEIFTKPYGVPGVVNELNLMVWGPDSWRKGGDAFSPDYISGWTENDMKPDNWYGYLYRVDVPASYVYDNVVVQLFDPDTYNKPGTPPAWPTYAWPSPTGIPNPNATPTNPDQYANCDNSKWGGECTSDSSAQYNTAMNLKAYGGSRVAFWRVDEIRNSHTAGDINPTSYNATSATTTKFTLWHFSTHISSAFSDPNTLSDQPVNSAVCGTGQKCIASYAVGGSTPTATDLYWYQPTGFTIKLRDSTDASCRYPGHECYERESNGSFYFYLYVLGTAGSSENNFDIRVGPPHSEVSANPDCTTANLNTSSYCYANRQNYNQADWDDGSNDGANPENAVMVYAKQSLPLNLDTGTSFPLVFTRVSKNAAGQVLSIKHFDQDCNGGCGSDMTYEMLKCNADPGNDSSWLSVGTGDVGPDNDWYCSTCANPETVQIPLETTSQYTQLFGSSGECESSLLRIHSNPSYSQDSTVWQMPYLRPRLIK